VIWLTCQITYCDLRYSKFTNPCVKYPTNRLLLICWSNLLANVVGLIVKYWRSASTQVKPGFYRVFLCLHFPEQNLRRLAGGAAFLPLIPVPAKEGQCTGQAMCPGFFPARPSQPPPVVSRVPEQSGVHGPGDAVTPGPKYYWWWQER